LITFEDVECTGSQLLASFSSSLFAWSCAWGYSHFNFIATFLDFLAFCTHTHIYTNKDKLSFVLKA